MRWLAGRAMSRGVPHIFQVLQGNVSTIFCCNAMLSNVCLSMLLIIIMKLLVVVEARGRRSRLWLMPEADGSG